MAGEFKLKASCASFVHLRHTSFRLCASKDDRTIVIGREPSARLTAEPPHHSIVVSPFASIGGNPEQKYFVDALTESLTTELSRITGFVIVGNTALTYKGKPNSTNSQVVIADLTTGHQPELNE